MNWIENPLSALPVLPLALALTYGMIRLAKKNGWLVKPKKDRWHTTPTALFGGVAIFAAFAIGSLFWLPALFAAKRADLLGLLVGATAIFALGLRDDIKPLNPLVKLFGQMGAVMPFLVGFGLSQPSTAFILSMPILFFWMVALTNALNLLDNMDGLSAGTAAVSGAMLTCYALLNGVPLVGVFSSLLVASCLGFLYFNFRPKAPARIFMGDCSSMLLGYLLAGLTVIGICPTERDGFSAVALPMLMLAVPIFDTLLVIVLRKREGRAVSQGGKDHSSHRLVYVGLSDKWAVAALWLVGLAFGGLALLADAVAQPWFTLLTLAASVIGFALFGAFLSRYSGPTKAAIRTEVSTGPVVESPS